MPELIIHRSPQHNDIPLNLKSHTSSLTPTNLPKMAVLNFVPGITAQVLINGKPAAEIRDPDPTAVQPLDPNAVQHQPLRTVSNYIESETGQEFSVKCTVKCPPYKMDSSKLCFFVYVDGHLGWILICERAPFDRQGQTEWRMRPVASRRERVKDARSMAFSLPRLRLVRCPFTFLFPNLVLPLMRFYSGIGGP